MSATPEHDKRDGGDHGANAPDLPMHPDIDAAYDYVDRVLHTADRTEGRSPMWYGWALREAFLAGMTHAHELSAREVEITTLGDSVRTFRDVDTGRERAVPMDPAPPEPTD